MNIMPRTKSAIATDEKTATAAAEKAAKKAAATAKKAATAAAEKAAAEEAAKKAAEKAAAREARAAAQSARTAALATETAATAKAAALAEAEEARKKRAAARELKEKEDAARNAAIPAKRIELWAQVIKQMIQPDGTYYSIQYGDRRQERVKDILRELKTLGLPRGARFSNKHPEAAAEEMRQKMHNEGKNDKVQDAAARFEYFRVLHGITEEENKAAREEAYPDSSPKTGGGYTRRLKRKVRRTYKNRR